MKKLDIDEYCRILNVKKEMLLRKKGDWMETFGMRVFSRVCDKKQVIFFDMRKRGSTYKEIADTFGLKSHVTVIKGINKIKGQNIYDEIKSMVELCGRV